MDLIGKVKQILKDNNVLFVETQEPNTIIFVEELYFIDYLFGICAALNIDYEVVGREFQNQQLVTVELKEGEDYV